MTLLHKRELLCFFNPLLPAHHGFCTEALRMSSSAGRFLQMVRWLYTQDP